jgi:thymidylate synthase (FAD)
LELLKLHEGNSEALFEALQAGKKKKNVGDAFKHIITDNVKVDMVVTFNLRSLKNYLTLRDSGAAYFQIRWLAQEMMRVTPSKYLDLIVKKK